MSTILGAGAALPVEQLVYPNERRLFGIAVVISALAWLALIIGTVGIALIYVLLAFIIYLFAQSAFISYLKGTAARITAEQFPDLYKRVADCSAKLGVQPAPEAFLLHGNGAFNAFATRFLGDNFIVLLSDVVDALEAEPEAINFYIGHEIGHIQRGHLKWGPFLFPASILPLLGAAYSRAREYTCDGYGLACCASPAAATKALAVLAAGARRWPTMDATRYAAQADESGGFWMSFHELTSGYPWLVKRMARVLGPQAAAQVPGRNVLAWVFAAFVPRIGGAGAGSLIVTIAIIGILAAVALPAYQDYTVRAKIAGAMAQGDRAAALVADYFYRTNQVPANLGAAGITFTPDATVQSMEIESSGRIRIQLAFSPLAGKAILLNPTLDANKRVVWKCIGAEVEQRYLPQRCR